MKRMTYFQMSMRTSKEFDKDVICNFVCTFFNLPRNSLTQYDANDDVAEMDHGIGAWPANQAFRKCLRCLTHFEKKKKLYLCCVSLPRIGSEDLMNNS